MILRMVRSLSLSLLLSLLALLACGAGGREASKDEGVRQGRSMSAAAAPAPAAPAALAAPRPFPTPAPAAPPAPGFALGGARGPSKAPGQAAGAPGLLAEFGSTEAQVVLVSQRRIIVRTVDMGLVVADVSKALDAASELAEELGGWVVSSDRSQKHRGFISLRVPADKLEDAVLRLRKSAVEVKSEASTSSDVTDEYVDTTARLKNFQATEEALLKLLIRADKVEDALKVQAELTRIQGEIERLQGRIKFLEQTSAFSLINASLSLAPADMSVDAGVNMTFSLREFARFRATFKPPKGIDSFTFEWDFGDGSPPVTGNRTAPTLEEGTRVTATVAHVYEDDRDSPYIVEVKLFGSGEAGAAEGEDTLIATVTELPTIEVFAGESVTVEEGDEVELFGSFTRPEGLRDLRFRWDFGDGTRPATGTLAADVTEAVARHVYADHRPFPFAATLTITGQSDAGAVEASSLVEILVTESPGWTFAGWSAGDTGRAAVRALSGVGQGLGTFFIWVGIFSPVWLIGGAIAVLARRRAKARASRPSGPSGPPRDAGSGAGQPTSQA